MMKTFWANPEIICFIEVTLRVDIKLNVSMSQLENKFIGSINSKQTFIIGR